MKPAAILKRARPGDMTFSEAAARMGMSASMGTLKRSLRAWSEMGVAGIRKVRSRGRGGFRWAIGTEFVERWIACEVPAPRPVPKPRVRRPAPASSTSDASSAAAGDTSPLEPRRLPPATPAKPVESAPLETASGNGYQAPDAFELRRVHGLSARGAMLALSEIDDDRAQACAALLETALASRSLDSIRAALAGAGAVLEQLATG